MAKEKTETVSITFKCLPEVKRATNILAAHDGLSLSEFIVKVLAEVIEVNGEILGNGHMDLRPKSPSRQPSTTKAKSTRKKKSATKADDSVTAPTVVGGDGV
ncbi:MAG: hypothetical protein IJQ82_05125 [Selenomonadaceae bacterium]|nr:hypothetical protein [Selenomonadaceae bacterium]